jgi:multisubunit Na+/H+ antiporter MnhB subunit
MIDWVNVFFNALWVLGAAVILAALSFYHYDAQNRGERLRVRLAAPDFQVWLSVGLVLISLGLALTGASWWERVLWALFCVVSAWQIRVSWRQWKAERD